jgi:16S rRNA (adenine1518-N6/adenine1519-N6)-dimethyltransferase
MPQTKREIQAILEQIGTGPRHRFGQNFMIDQNLVRAVADAGEIRAEDLVIEVGPGTGTLTEELLSRGAKVLAVEIDRDLAALLRERFNSEPKFELIEGDALAGKHELNPELLRAATVRERIEASARSAPLWSRLVEPGAASLKLVANLPYNIASPLIIDLLIAGVELLAFTVQKEVADRLRAKENDDAYGPLSVMAQLLSRVEVLRTLPPQAFWPAPKIASALVRMRRENQLRSADRARNFSRFLHEIFSARRKTIRRALERTNAKPTALQLLNIDPQLRPENLAPVQFLALYDVVTGSDGDAPSKLGG